MKSFDVIIVGSGIGGLCCGSILSLLGKKVLICEAHSKPGGVAHSFSNKGYNFESGPSLWSGLSKWPSNNPLKQILYLIDEDVDVIKYKEWKVLLPEAYFNLKVGNTGFKEIVRNLRGDLALNEWIKFLKSVEEISRVVNKIPLLSHSIDKNLWDKIKLAKQIIPDFNSLIKLQSGFGEIVDEHLNDPFLRNWTDLLSFLISGMSMYDTNTAAMATLFNEWFDPNCYLEYPKGGSQAVVNALIRGFQKNGGELLLSSKVENIILNNKIASGIRLKNGKEYTSNAVVLNCDIWQSRDLLPNKIVQSWKLNINDIKKCNSFLHIHLGFDASGIKDLPIHTIWVDKWERGITADRNIVVFSVPSVLDPEMAPKGKHILHGYTPANEPWEIWEKLKGDKKSYEIMKEKRCSVFFKALSAFIPDIKERTDIQMLGTPLTHNHFTNTHNGSYGPAISAAKRQFPGCKTPINNLFVCGASAFPGIGIPAVAASGAFAAEAIVGEKVYKKLISKVTKI